MIRPVAVLAMSPDSFLVLDQGYGALLQVQNESIELPHGLRKEFNHFNSLVSTCYTDEKSILFTDSKLNHIYSIPEDNREIKIFNDTLILQQPTGIAFNKVTQQVWVVETAAHRIRILDKRGIPLKTIGKRGTGEGDFNFPTFICQGKSGTMFIVDAMNFRIQQFSPEGEFISSFGEAGDASGYLARPKGIATDTAGNIYIVDALLHGVQVFNTEGTFLYKFGQQGHENEDFWLPAGISIDRNNFIYVADAYNSRVQVFRLISE